MTFGHRVETRKTPAPKCAAGANLRKPKTIAHPLPQALYRQRACPSFLAPNKPFALVNRVQKACFIDPPRRSANIKHPIISQLLTFVLSLSKDEWKLTGYIFRSWFDKLTTNGRYRASCKIRIYIHEPSFPRRRESIIR
jgi:hypothetical protein